MFLFSVINFHSTLLISRVVFLSYFSARLMRSTKNLFNESLSLIERFDLEAFLYTKV